MLDARPGIDAGSRKAEGTLTIHAYVKNIPNRSTKASKVGLSLSRCIESEKEQLRPSRFAGYELRDLRPPHPPTDLTLLTLDPKTTTTASRLGSCCALLLYAKVLAPLIH